VGSRIEIELVDSENCVPPTRLYRSDNEVQESSFTEEELREIRRLAGNDEVPAYLVLLSQGYDVDRAYLDRSQQVEEWTAQRDGHRFSAAGPIELLGVVSVFEARGEDWKAADPDIDAFMARFYPSD
jgi:hypothetical protein